MHDYATITREGVNFTRQILYGQTVQTATQTVAEEAIKQNVTDSATASILGGFLNGISDKVSSAAGTVFSPVTSLYGGLSQAVSDTFWYVKLAAVCGGVGVIAFAVFAARNGGSVTNVNITIDGARQPLGPASSPKEQGSVVEKRVENAVRSSRVVRPIFALINQAIEYRQELDQFVKAGKMAALDDELRASVNAIIDRLDKLKAVKYLSRQSKNPEINRHPLWWHVFFAAAVVNKINRVVYLKRNTIMLLKEHVSNAQATRAANA